MGIARSRPSFWARLPRNLTVALSPVKARLACEKHLRSLSEDELPTRVFGRTSGLKASQLQSLERLYRRRVPRTHAAPSDLVRELAALSHELGRRLGVLIDRSGELTHVFVGDATLLELPPLDTARRGQGRLKGLRWI